jgi:hypothetical protein
METAMKSEQGRRQNAGPAKLGVFEHHFPRHENTMGTVRQGKAMMNNE